MTDALPLLISNLGVSAVCFVVLWLISIPLKDPSYVDAWWGLGVVVLAWSTYVQLDAPGPHATALLLLASAWGLRLGAYLLWRWRSHGADRRYAKLAQRAKDKHGLNFAMFSLLWVFAPQLLLQIVMALPAQLGQATTATSLGWPATLGLWLAIFGIIYEAIADAQLSHFKSQSDNSGKVMDRGLWRYSRHPNYFGEACLWWGLGLMGLAGGGWERAWCLLSPLMMTLLLLRVSGVTLLEQDIGERRPAYRDYVARTSAFIPWPPRRGAGR